ncbi:MAG: hypothetical protein H0U27_14425 [Nitrosopumilus sp.]|nr:hypothetical protein [Nitrosopumilus sp.]
MSTHLDFQTLRRLCQSDPQYAKLCRQERFLKLIRQRYREYQIDAMFEILTHNRNIQFQISKTDLSETDDFYSHQIRLNNNGNRYSLVETLTNYPITNAISLKLLPSDQVRETQGNMAFLITNIKELRAMNLTRDDIERILEYLIINHQLDLRDISATPGNPYPLSPVTFFP